MDGSSRPLQYGVLCWLCIALEEGQPRKENQREFSNKLSQTSIPQAFDAGAVGLGSYELVKPCRSEKLSNRLRNQCFVAMVRPPEPFFDRGKGRPISPDVGCHTKVQMRSVGLRRGPDQAY